MRRFSLANSRNPLWPWLGAGMLGATAVASGILLVSRPQAVAPVPTSDPFKGMARTRQGTFTEQLGQGTFVLGFQEVVGDPANLDLHKVHGTLTEPLVRWEMDSPGAQRRDEAWILGGPLEVEAREPRKGTLLGTGHSEGRNGALQWRNGTWTGLAPLTWRDLAGRTKGTWQIPAGWHRTAEGRFLVRKGPITWQAEDPGAVRTLTSQTMDASFGLGDARMEEVEAGLEGGTVQAAVMTLDADTYHWQAPIRFQRTDGWQGGATSGTAPRPPEGQPVSQVDWTGFQAARPLHGGEERIRADQGSWMPVGLQLQGNIVWNCPLEPGRRQPGDPDRVEIRAPRVLFREHPGGMGLPEDLPAGTARAEGGVAMAWGTRSLATPRVDAHQVPRRYVIHAPATGRTEFGTFSAGTGEGTPRHWLFQGPVEARLQDGGRLRGGQLVWEGDTWSLEGRPVTYLGLAERLSGGRVIWQDKAVIFPQGIQGSLTTAQGEMQVRASRGLRKGSRIELEGSVTCRLAAWHLEAERIVVFLGEDGKVARLEASGGVSLSGAQGQGRGDRLMMDLAGRTLQWDGHVRGTVEMSR